MRPVRFGHYLAYGSNDFLGAGAMAVISGWILFFYTTFCGLTPVQAAAIFAIARLFDAVASPLIGYLSDHFHRTRLGRKFGRRRFFVLLAVPLLPSFALMWIEGQSFWYYLVTYVFFEVVYAMELIPYETLAAEMSPDYKVKAKFAGARILCGQIAAILAGVLPGRIIEHFGKQSAETFLYLGIIFSVIFMLVALAVFTFSWERPREEIESIASEDHVSPLRSLRRLYSDLWATMRIRAFRLHLGMYLGGYISQDIFNAAFTYFVVFALGSTVVAASNYLGAMAFAQLLSVAVFIPMCLHYHPAPSYRIAVSLFGVAVLGFLALHHAQPAQAWWIYVPVLVAGLGRGGLNYIPWNVYNYMADVDEIVTGRRREGAFAGVMTFVRKTTQAAAVMGVGLILQAGGFVAGSATQSSEAVTTILIVMGLGTLTLLTFGFFVSLRFHLNRETHEVLMGEIKRFKEQPGTEPTPENRRIVEDLSGWPYERLWGRGAAANPPQSFPRTRESMP
ncbi:oligogalacturonide transporter [Povalibacter uvarum]|uniref:Oligogalacturonide transporter n=1 Tax=Povalibacter uvarum TaxID=732238 RepID=A0A841HS37_9GAMM|nr:MFS transporter [Povalibacter uvarum]MBB6095464.1 oligogalacturonide transporter [Povalibacter uvarum]